MNQIVSLGPQLADRVRLFAGVHHDALLAEPIQSLSSVLTPEASSAIFERNDDERAFWRFESWGSLANVLQKSTLTVHADLKSPWASLAAAYHLQRSFSAETHELSFHSYLTIGIATNSMTHTIEERDLKPEIRGWLEKLRGIETSSQPNLDDASDIREQFRRKYGTGYVRRVEEGGVMGIRTVKTFATAQQARSERFDLSLESLIGSASVSTSQKTKMEHKNLQMVSTGWTRGGKTTDAELPIGLESILDAAAKAQQSPERADNDPDTGVSWRSTIPQNPAIIAAEIEPYHVVCSLELFGTHRLSTRGRRVFSMTTGRGPRKHEHIAAVEAPTGFGGTAQVVVPVMTPHGTIVIEEEHLEFTLRWQRDLGLRNQTSALQRAWEAFSKEPVPPFPQDAAPIVLLGDGSGASNDEVFDWLLPIESRRDFESAMNRGEIVVRFRAPAFAMREVVRRIQSQEGVQCTVVVPFAGSNVEISSGPLNAQLEGSALRISAEDPEAHFTGEDEFACHARMGWQEYPQKLYAGQKVHVTASGGITLTKKKDAASAYGRNVGPEGTPAGRYKKTKLSPVKHALALVRALEWNRDRNILDMEIDRLKKGEATPQHGCLIGRWRPADGTAAGEPFLIGRGGQFSIVTDGFLQLRVNDEHIVNNSGSFALVLRISD